MKDNQKILIRNLTNNKIGFGCVNFPAKYIFNPGQVLAIKEEHLEDVSYDKGFRYMLENGMLKIESNNENYNEIMDDLQVSHLLLLGRLLLS